MTLLVLLVCCALSASASAVHLNGTIIFAVPSNETVSKNEPQYPNIEPRIIGGVPSKVPIKWQVSLRRQQIYGQISPQYLKHFCGGALISERHILTAANCFDGSLLDFLRSGRIYAVLGTLLNDFDPSKSFVSMITSGTLHPNYDRINPKAHHDDIAVLKMLYPAPQSEHIRPLPLSTELPTSGTRCLVSGWGVAKYGEENSKVLMAAMIPILDKDLCISMYNSYGLTVTEDMLCAGYKKGVINFGQGDIGGPLMCRGRLAGVISWGLNVEWAESQIPGMYSSVLYHYSWITETMARLDRISSTSTSTTSRPTTPKPSSATRSTVDILSFAFISVITTKILIMIL